VTGGAGYIGSHTRYFLQKSRHSVIVVDNLERGCEQLVPANILRKLDLHETEKLTALLKQEQIEAVIHFAAYISVGESTQFPELYFTNNTCGSMSLFNAMLAAGVKRVVFSSTAAAYGTPTRVPIEEDQPYAPINPYGESKVMTEKVLDWLDKYREFRNVRLRYFNASGAVPEAGLGELHDPETHLIPLMLRAIQTDKPITVFGDDYATPDGTCIRDYIHVADLAEAHLLAVEHLLNGGESNVFNVGTGSGCTVKQVLDAVERITGKKVPHTIGPRREGDPASLVANSDRLQKTLGWKPTRVDIDTIVRDAWAFANR
jgi:UDP-glucose-4-epimerase GalE